MAMPAEAFTIESLPPPEVNRDKSDRVLLQKIMGGLNEVATANTSGTIAARETAWDRYAADAMLGTLSLRSDFVSSLLTNAYASMDEVKTFEGVFVGSTSPTVVYTLQPTRMALLGFEELNVDPLSAYRSNQRVVAESREEALAEIRRRLDAATALHARKSPGDVVAYLSESIGVGQLSIARALRVSPTAVRKWRRGESARPEHRARLAQFAALSGLLDDLGPHDPAGWLDIQVSNESELTPLDLFLAGRSDLVVLLGAELADPQETLDEFDGSWRTKFGTDPDYEVVTLADGSRSVLPKPGTDA
jgi:transcriptional regulator with XRE-family HTH domain